MTCPYCFGGSKVQESREPTTGEYRKRRRKCNRCGKTWSTIEIDIDEYKQMAKAAGYAENYNPG